MNAADFQVSDQLALWWLADPAQPQLIGTLRHFRRQAQQPGGVSLSYSPQWLATGHPLSEDLPLRAGEFLPAETDAAAGAVDDSRPDRWGERIIRFIDRPARLSTLEYLYFAGDDRFGALGVSTSHTDYLPRRFGALPSLSEVQAMHDLVRQVEAGEPVAEPLRRLVRPGATLGGARPKALLDIDGEQWIVKFAEVGDVFDSPLIEHASMKLAQRAGIEVCETMPLPLSRGHAVAVHRFDRMAGRRRHALSAHVALRAAGEAYGYPELALLLRRRGPADLIAAQGEQLFRRMVFNAFIDNTDDHEKNHALIVNAAQQYQLSPAYDVLPAGQALGYQLMRVGSDGSESSWRNLVSEHRAFALTAARAKAVGAEVAQVVQTWRTHFKAVGVTDSDIDLLSQQIDRPFLSEQRNEAMA